VRPVFLSFFLSFLSLKGKLEREALISLSPDFFFSDDGKEGSGGGWPAGAAAPPHRNPKT
jgi:hypothetical protein